MSTLQKFFDTKMQALFSQIPTRVAVAVSGGADSLCLTFLLKKWADAKHIKLFAFTVDHGLRKESRQEAQEVHKKLQQVGILHKTLVWKGEKPKTRIEELTSMDRYYLLQKACQKN